MNDFNNQNAGLYLDGSSLLHRLDPRLKLGLLLLMIITLFAVPGPVQLALLSVICGFSLLTCRIPFLQVLLKLVHLRWLLLFTVLLHLFFTPGRTLLGTSWLSLDGLLRGLTVDLQLVLALILSFLLARTTSPSDLAWGLTRLLAPLSRFGVPVREAGGLLLMVLHFLPLVREEAGSLSKGDPGTDFIGRVRSAVGLIGPLLLRLVDRADSLAHDIVSDGFFLGNEMSESGKPVGLENWLVLVAIVPVMILIWTL